MLESIECTLWRLTISQDYLEGALLLVQDIFKSPTTAVHLECNIIDVFMKEVVET